MMDHSVPQPSPVVADSDSNMKGQGQNGDDSSLPGPVGGEAVLEGVADMNRRPSTVRLLLKNSVVHFEEETEGAPPSLQEMCRQRSQSDMTANKTDASVLIGKYDPVTQELQYVDPYRIDDDDDGSNPGPFPSYPPQSSSVRQHQPGLEGIEEINDYDEDEEGLLGSCPSSQPASARVFAHLDGLLATPPLGPAQEIPPAVTTSLSPFTSHNRVDSPRQQHEELQTAQKAADGHHPSTGVRKGGGLTRYNRESQAQDGGSNTTIMFRNIPNRFSPEGLREVIRDKGFATSMDFFYMPMDFQNQCNLGYAFINFVNVDELDRFTQEFHGQKLPLYKSHKVCEVCPARVQGLKANVDHFRKSAARGSIPDEYKPVCFRNGEMVPFPPSERPFHRSGNGEDHRRSSKSSAHSGKFGGLRGDS